MAVRSAIWLFFDDMILPSVDVIPEGCRLRLGMTNPPYILEHLEEMARILNHPR